MCTNCGCGPKKESKFEKFVHDHEHTHGDMVHSHPHEHGKDHEHAECAEGKKVEHAHDHK